MSGGYFEYKQFNIDDIVDKLDEYINGRELDEDDIDEIVSGHHRTPPNYHIYSDKTIAEFRKGLKILKQASVYAQRIDWLLSGDDSEESFHRRLKEGLAKIEK